MMVRFQKEKKILRGFLENKKIKNVFGWGFFFCSVD